MTQILCNVLVNSPCNFMEVITILCSKLLSISKCKLWIPINIYRLRQILLTQDSRIPGNWQRQFENINLFIYRCCNVTRRYTGNLFTSNFHNLIKDFIPKKSFFSSPIVFMKKYRLFLGIWTNYNSRY